MLNPEFYEFLTENTLGGNFVLPTADDNHYLNRTDVRVLGDIRINTVSKPFDSELLHQRVSVFSVCIRASHVAIYAQH
jgi:hypothetical protein